MSGDDRRFDLEPFDLARELGALPLTILERGHDRIEVSAARDRGHETLCLDFDLLETSPEPRQAISRLVVGEFLEHAIRDRFNVAIGEPALQRRHDHHASSFSAEIVSALSQIADALKATIERVADVEADEARARQVPAILRGERPGAARGGDFRLFGALDMRELRGLVGGSGSGSAVVTVDFANWFQDRLAPQSVALASGVTVVATERNSLKFPKVTADVSAAWTSEAGTISASDPTISQVTASPKKLAALSQVSNELIDDSEPAVLRLLETNLTRALALKFDLGFFEGSGSGSEITGPKNVSGIGSVSMGTNGATPTNLDPLADAIGTLA